MNWTELQSLVPSAGHSYDWARCCMLVPKLLALESTPQDPRHHAEGNVGLHTRMVLDALMLDAHWVEAPRGRQEEMFLAALFHDIAKPETTVIDEMTGRITQPGHSARGSVDVRILLWKAAAPFAVRERICRMVAKHQVPFFAFESKRGESPEYIARMLSWEMNVADLICVAKADMVGRQCEDQAGKLDDIALFGELAAERGCLEQPGATASPHTRVMYARGMQLDPDYPLHQMAGSQVTVLCGLPASGKDTWVDKHAGGRAVVSFDDAKEALGLRHGQNDGMAAHYAVERARGLLRRKEAFIWNATHLSRQMRGKTLTLLFDYHASVQVVYIEAEAKVVFARNSKRDSTLSNKDLERMLYRWEVPVPWEAHEVVYACE